MKHFMRCLLLNGIYMGANDQLHKLLSSSTQTRGDRRLMAPRVVQDDELDSDEEDDDDNSDNLDSSGDEMSISDSDSDSDADTQDSDQEVVARVRQNNPQPMAPHAPLLQQVN